MFKQYISSSCQVIIKGNLQICHVKITTEEAVLTDD